MSDPTDRTAAAPSLGRETLPFFLKSGAAARAGCLLLHGFTATPHEMRYLGDALQTCGYAVNGVRLAGHGTSVDDFARATWHDWYASAVAGLQALHSEAPRRVAVGQSMGALLALKLAVEHPDTIAGVALLSPALVLSNPWAERLRPALPLLVRLTRRRGRLQRASRDVADRHAASESPSYQQIPLPALHQLLTLQQHVRALLPRVRQPVLIIHSRQDHTCPVHNVALLEGGLGGPRRTVLLDNSFHVISIDVDKERVAAEVAGFVESVA